MRRFTLAVVVMLIALSLAAPLSVHADYNDFLITDFSADETLSKQDPQGELHVVERISVDFLGHNHGILRAIPGSYKGHTLKFHLNNVRSDTAAPTHVSTSSSNGNVVLRIGDPNRTVTHNQEYTIDYTLQNVISFYNDHDELYWDINGDQWQEPFTTVEATIHLPSGVALTSRQPRCFNGVNGSTSQDCTVVTGDKTIYVSAANVDIHHTVTYVVGFQKGYFAPMTLWQKLADYAAPITEIVAPILLSLIGGSIWWLKRGRDAKGRGTIVPEYQPPADLSPLEAGTLVDFKVDNRDITATIIDLARRHYLQIIENREDHKLWTDKVSYQLRLTNTDASGLTDDEIKLLNALFPENNVGTEVQVATLKNKLYKTALSLRKSVTTRLTSQGYFRRNPYTYTTWGTFSTSAFIILGIIFFNIHLSASAVPLVIGIIGAVIIWFMFRRAMPARTAKGVAANEQLLGLKLYMQTAEKDRLEKLEGPNAAYAANAGAPARTVELFEKLLPYAIAMGVETQWAGKFNDIYTQPPDWYSGNWATFNAGYFVGTLNSGFSDAMGASFASPSSSGGSGFGGGGFAGGGGGGGGGGGW